tara:strand:- start:2556 stop:3410 length:855 start_codon:yes stop_codon:yes gene_type:complete
MKKVSIVIPVYNVEKYLSKCLDSVCNQTLKDIEIICINDCSQDNSLEVLQKYAEEDSRIKLVDFKENKGVSVARNTGISLATGEYIGFIDSDDYIDFDFYEKLYKLAKKESADICKGSDLTVIDFDNSVYTSDMASDISKNKLNFWCQYTTAIFRNSFLKEFKIDFDTRMIICEDLDFNLKSSIFSNKIVLENTVKYYYVRRDNSLNSKLYDSAKVDSLLIYAEKVFTYLNSYNLTLSDKMLIANRVIAQLNAAKNHRVDKNSEEYTKIFKFYGQYVVKKMKLK